MLDDEVFQPRRLGAFELWSHPIQAHTQCYTASVWKKLFQLDWWASRSSRKIALPSGSLIHTWLLNHDGLLKTMNKKQPLIPHNLSPERICFLIMADCMTLADVFVFVVCFLCFFHFHPLVDREGSSECACVGWEKHWRSREERNSLELHWPHEERGRHLGLIPPWTLRTLYNNTELMSEGVLEPVKAKKLEGTVDCNSSFPAVSLSIINECIN